MLPIFFGVQRLLPIRSKTKGNWKTTTCKEKHATPRLGGCLHGSVLLTICALPVNTHLGDQKQPLGHEDESKTSKHLFFLGDRKQQNLPKVKDTRVNHCPLNLSGLICSCCLLPHHLPISQLLTKKRFNRPLKQSEKHPNKW